MRSERDWFNQFMDEEQYMAIQGGWVETQCYDIFLYFMQGLIQKEIPIDLRVQIKSPSFIWAEIPGRDPKSPYGYFTVRVSANELEVIAVHPRWREFGEMYVYQFDMLAPMPELNWKGMNEFLEWIE